MSFKLIGALTLCLGSAALGFTASGNIKRTLKTLRQLKQSFERMRCEVSYAHKPVGQICEDLQADTTGEVSEFYRKLSVCYSGAYPTEEDRLQTVSAATLRSLPPSVLSSVTELAVSFGKYGMEEQLRLIDKTAEQINEALAQLNAERAERCKCYETLGICTGLAVAILVL